MITGIPNQPINFLPFSVITECPDKRIPLNILEDDVLRFQVAIDAPSGGGSYGYSNEVRNWQVVSDWGSVGGGSWVSNVLGWQCNTASAPGAYLRPLVNPFAPTVGAVYQVVVDIHTITGTSTFSMGGQTFSLSAPGQFAFMMIAANTDDARVTLDTAESFICLAQVRVFEIIGADESCTITVDVVDAETGDVLREINSDDHPGLFVITAGSISVSVLVSGIEAIDGRCVYLRISSSCDDGGDPLCSQPIRVGDCAGAIVVRACLDHDAMGFGAPAIFDVRLKASLVRPRFEYETSEERWSDGTINRYYIDRQRTMDLLIQLVDEALHPFLAALCMFDHVYIGDDEYSVDANGYDPAYGESTGTAAVALVVRPKRELLRRVTCEEPGPGCDPANDPPCDPANVFIDYVWSEDDQGYIITVNVYAAVGFVPERVRMYVDGVLSDDIAWVSPTEYIFGPVPASSDIIIELSNSTVPECDWRSEFRTPACPREYPPYNLVQTDICDEEPQMFYIDLELVDGLGFIVQGIRVTIDGVFYEDQLNGPNDYVVGPFGCEDVIGIVVLDGAVEPCNRDLGTFECECGPCDAYPIYPDMYAVDFIATADQQATIEGGSLTLGWTFLIQDLPDATPPGATLWEQNTGNVAMWNGSGWDIDVITPGTVIDVLANGASPDYDKWWVVRGAASGTTLYPSGKMALQWLYPARSSDDDPSPGSRVFDRSFLTLERADSNDLSECRRCFVEQSSNEVDWFAFGNYNEVEAMTTFQNQFDDVYTRVTWYGGPTGTDVQGVSIVRYFPF